MRQDDPRRAPAGYEPVDHTADIGLRFWGRTPEELFEQAALGVASLLVRSGAVRAAERRQLAVEAVDLEEALVAWLQEILYQYEVRRFVLAEAEVRRADPAGADGEIRGETVDPGRHERGLDIKAATYHDLKIRRSRDADGAERWETTVIFDI